MTKYPAAKSRLPYVLLSFSLLLAFSVFLHPLKADAVTVGPVKLEYSLNPGDVVHGEVYLKNEEADTKTFYPSFERFTEQNGNKVFTNDDTLLKEWFKFEPSVTLKSGEDNKIPFTLSIPQNAPPGGQFGVLWWSTTPPGVSGTEQVSIQTRAGILVYINVSGDVLNSAEVTHFALASGGRVSWGGPVSLSLQISNTGNVYIKPTGKVRISSIFGTVSAEPSVNPKGYQILPKSYRDLGDMQWVPGIFSIGPYKAVAEVIYGEKGESVTASKWIWVLPVKSIAVVIVVIIVLILFFKWYNRMLLKRHKVNS